jgi:hypothetical protein
MSNVTINSVRVKPVYATVDNLEYGDCFTTSGYEGSNMYMKIELGYLNNSSISKEKAKKGYVPVIGIVNGNLRFIKGDTFVDKFKSVDITTTK